MAAINQIAFRTPIAAVHVPDHPLRVYTLDNSGGIRESVLSTSNKWSGGDATLAIGKIGTPLSATAKNNKVGVQYLSPDNKLRELCNDGSGWYPSNDLMKNDIAVASYSQMASCMLPGEQPRERIYVQLENDTIQEYYWDYGQVGFTAGANMGEALPGTAIAVTAFINPSGESIRVYFQAPDLSVVEHVHENSPFIQSTFSIPSAIPRTAMTVACCTGPFSSAATGPSLRLYYIGQDNMIREKCNDTGTWFDGGFTHGCIPGSDLAVLSWGKGDRVQFRMYFQEGKMVTAVSEMCYSVEKGWYQGRIALPPAVILME